MQRVNRLHLGRLVGRVKAEGNADNEAENIEYLQRTTVHPNEAVSGYLLIDDKRTDTLHVDIDINGVTYSYEWDMRKKK